MDAMGKLKEIIEKEFPGFMAVSSIADGNDYDLLDVFYVDSKRLWRWIPFLRYFKSTLRHVGSLSHKTKRQAHVIKKFLIDQAEEKDFYAFDQLMYMDSKTLRGGIQAKPFCTLHGLHNCKCEVILNLGTITKRRLIYEDIAEELKKLKSFTDDFVLLSKKKHLLIIYEVLYAERLQLKSSANLSFDAACEIRVNQEVQKADQRADQEPTVINKNVSKPPLATGQFKSDFETLLAVGRPAEMGRFPIAYKCGRVRVVDVGKGKTRKMLKLSRIDRFHKPFDPTDKRWGKPTSPDLESPPSSMELEY